MRVYIQMPDNRVTIVNRSEEDATDEELLAAVGGKAVINEIQAREAFRNEIMTSIQIGVQTITDPDQRSTLQSLITSLPPDVRELIGENFLQAQMDVIATGLPNV